MLLWVQKNPHLLIGFPQRARELVPITKEAVEFLLQTGKIYLTQSGELEVSPGIRALSKTKFIDEEIAECIRKVSMLQSGLHLLERRRQSILNWGYSQDADS